MKKNFNEALFDKWEEEGENERLNTDSKNNNLFESIKVMDQIENLLTEKIDNPPSSINGSTGESNYKEKKNEIYPK